MIIISAAKRLIPMDDLTLSSILFQWIPPGSFLMGSPLEEPDRCHAGKSFPDEKQHSGGWSCYDRICKDAILKYYSFGKTKYNQGIAQILRTGYTCNGDGLGILV